MQKSTFLSVLATLATSLFIQAQAAVVVSEGFTDNSYLANCGPDRYEPAFVGSVGGTLTLTATSDDAIGNRPSGFNTTFYNTQGIKCTAPAGVVKASVDFYASSDLLSLPGNRRGGFWATGENAQDTISAYPLMEVASTGTELFAQMWDPTGSFVFVDTLALDAWYRLTLALDVVNDEVEYYLDNVLVGVFDANETTSLRDVMFQTVNQYASNDFGSFDIKFDNLELETADVVNDVPEPGSLALALLACGLLPAARRQAQAKHKAKRLQMLAGD